LLVAVRALVNGVGEEGVFGRGADAPATRLDRQLCAASILRPAAIGTRRTKDRLEIARAIPRRAVIGLRRSVAHTRAA
jgi:hypothetical protein